MAQFKDRVADKTPSAVLAFDLLVSGAFTDYLKASQILGGDVTEQAELVNQGIKAQREFLLMASGKEKPSDTEITKLLQPLSESIVLVQSFREKNRASLHFNHLSAVSEGIPAFGWVAVVPAPATYIKQMQDASQFYTNRVLKEWKEKDRNHVNWTNSWLQFLIKLEAFVQNYHTTGLNWKN